MAGFDRASIDELFTYHTPVGSQQSRYIELRSQHKRLAEKILELTPSSAEQTLAIRALHLSSMHANTAIALEPPGTVDLHGEAPSG
jgi:hypothetical protein